MMTVDVAAVVEPVGDVTAALGEGPYWVPEDDCLLWVDIEAARLHRTYFPSKETVTDSPGPISAAFPAVGGGILIVGGSALTLLFPAQRGGQGVARTIADAPARDGIRFNDAGVDPAGRVWAGSMHVAEAEPVGELYRLHPRGRTNPGGEERPPPHRARLVPGRRGDVPRRPARAPSRRVRLRPGQRRGLRPPGLRRPVRRRRRPRRADGGRGRLRMGGDVGR